MLQSLDPDPSTYNAQPSLVGVLDLELELVAESNSIISDHICRSFHTELNLPHEKVLKALYKCSPASHSPNKYLLYSMGSIQTFRHLTGALALAYQQDPPQPIVG